ncbi:hypothetical protein ACHWQZ_G017658, partial [Mnemiopsis leidyi]
AVNEVEMYRQCYYSWVQLLIFLILVLSLWWIFGYLGGLIPGATELLWLLNWHQFLMLLAFAACFANAVIVYRMVEAPLTTQMTLHNVYQFLCLALVVLGLTAVVTWKAVARDWASLFLKQAGEIESPVVALPHPMNRVLPDPLAMQVLESGVPEEETSISSHSFYTFHSWVGLFTVLAFLAQLVLTLSREWRDQYSQMKIILIVFTFVSATVATITGIEDVVFYRYIDGLISYSNYPLEGILVNSLCLLLLLLLLLVTWVWFRASYSATDRATYTELDNTDNTHTARPMKGVHV